jgi:hypothetical protein
VSLRRLPRCLQRRPDPRVYPVFGHDRPVFDADGRPRTRAGCASIPRPCPYVRCRYHLHLDVGDRTVVHREPPPADTPPASCALDEAEQGAHTDEELAEVLGVPEDEVRDVLARALRRLRDHTQADVLHAIFLGYASQRPPPET